MLRSVSQFLHSRYLRRKGCLGLACYGDSFAYVRYRYEKGVFTTVDQGNHPISEYSDDEFSRFFEDQELDGALISVGLSSELVHHFTLEYENLPSNRKKREKFLGWRYQNYVKGSVNQLLAHSVEVAHSVVMEQEAGVIVGHSSISNEAMKLIKYMKSSRLVVQNTSIIDFQVPNYINAVLPDSPENVLFVYFGAERWTVQLMVKAGIVYSSSSADCSVYPKEELDHIVYNVESCARYFQEKYQLLVGGIIVLNDQEDQDAIKALERMLESISSNVQVRTNNVLGLDGKETDFKHLSACASAYPVLAEL